MHDQEDSGGARIHSEAGLNTRPLQSLARLSPAQPHWGGAMEEEMGAADCALGAAARAALDLLAGLGPITRATELAGALQAVQEVRAGAQTDPWAWGLERACGTPRRRLRRRRPQTLASS